MALFKAFRGNRATLNAQEKHDGFAYFCTNDGSFHIDYTDAGGALQRKQITASKTSTISLPVSSWTKSNNVYSQVVTVSGVTANSKVDIHPTLEQLIELQSAGITLVAVNEDGVVTVCAFNNKPASNYTMQVTLTEVSTDETKIVGHTITAPSQCPDWNQTDEAKADFIKNKPDLDDVLKYTDQALTDTQKAQARENIDAPSVSEIEILHRDKADVYAVWEDIEYEEITGAAVTSSGSLSSQSSCKYTKVNIEGYSKLKITGYQWNPSYNFVLCVFFDKNETVLSFVQLTNGTQYTDYEVDVPTGATFVVVNGKIGNVIALCGLKIYNCKTLFEEKTNRIARWVTPQIIVTDGIYANGKTEATLNEAQLGIVDIRGYEKVIVSGYQFTSPAVCYFYDELDNVISSHRGTTTKQKVILELDVPKNATTLKVNGQKWEAKVDVSAFQKMDIEDIYEIIRPSGKKLITLGDSITALGTGNRGWVKYFIEKIGCELVANVAVNGAGLMDRDATFVYDGDPQQGEGNDPSNVLGNQVQKIINNNYEAPDIIMIAIGTNNGIYITKDDIKNAYYDAGNNLIPLANVDRTTSAGAYRWCLEKLNETYPNAIIFWCTPIMGYQKTRSAENAMAYAESLRIATEYTGQILIDTIRCGINGANELDNANGRYLIDGLHPNVNGAKKIGYYNASKVLPFISNGFILQS